MGCFIRILIWWREDFDTDYDKQASMENDLEDRG